MEQFFLIALGVAAFFTLLLGGLGIRALLRRGDAEISRWFVRGTRRRVGAVMWTTVSEGLRMKVAVVFLAVLAVAIPVTAQYGSGDGTVKGRVQMFLGYSLGLTTFLLSILTVVLSTRSLAAEIAGRQVFGMVSKPIPRWQVVAGKWLGVVVLNVGLLTAAGAATYAGVRFILARFHQTMRHELMVRGGLTEAQARACLSAIENIRGPGGKGVDSPIIPAMADALGWSNQQVVDLLLGLPERMRIDLRRLDELRRQVLVGRAYVRPPEPDLRREIEERYAKLREEGRLPAEMSESRAKEELAKALSARERAVAPQSIKEWRLAGPPPLAGAEFLLSLRFKFEGYTRAMQMFDGSALEEETVLAQWCVGDPTSADAFYWPEPIAPKPLNTFLEFEVPRQAVARDGVIQVRVANIDPRMTTLLLAKDGLEVLYAASSFGGNLARATIVLLLPLTLLAAVGVMFSTFCTFPVGALVTLTVFAISSSSEFLYDAIGLTESMYPINPTFADEVRRFCGDVLVSAMSMGTIDAVRHVVEGRLIGWSALGGEALRTVALKAGATLLLGIHIFRRRELAAVIVQ